MSDWRELPEGAEIGRLGYRYLPGAAQGGPNFLAILRLTAPSSGELTYTLYVVDGSEEGTLFASQSTSGDGSESPSFELVVNAGAEQAVGVYATSSVKDQEIFRLPVRGAFAVEPLPPDSPLKADDPNDWEFCP